VTTTGAAVCWGQDTWGQLGDGVRPRRPNLPVNSYRTRPTFVVGLKQGVRAVAGGGSHSCAVTTVGGVECWGRNTVGQLGNGTLKNSSVPVDVVGLSHGVVAVGVGAFHSCALTSAGGVKCWGFNGHNPGTNTIGSGELGDGTERNSSKPVDVVGLKSGVAAISVGGATSCAVMKGGGVECWGNNVLTPTAVAGFEHGIAGIDVDTSVCAVTTAGALACRYFPGGEVFFSYPAGVKNSGGSCVLLGRGGVKCSTPNGNGWVAVPGLSTGVASLAAAGVHSGCALMTNGGVKCWGLSSGGLLGDGRKRRGLSNVPVDVVAPRHP
jgi:alpha-tubulin suppressor-like RCC1 family protein